MNKTQIRLFGQWLMEHRRHAISSGLTIASRLLWYLARRAIGPRTFIFGNQRLAYFLHPFIMSTERIVEIPIALSFLRKRPGANILEVGNVLSPYYSFRHDVIDKYERAHGVINDDIRTFWPGKQYDLIICISTLEHVGYDDRSDSTNDGALKALTNIKSRLLADSGDLLVTIPLGYNSHLDSMIWSGKLCFDEMTFLQRKSRWNVWQPFLPSNGIRPNYGEPYPCGNVIAVGLWKKTSGLTADKIRNDL